MKSPRARTVAYLLLGTGLFLFLVNTGVFGALPAFLWLTLLLGVGAAFWLGSFGALSLWQRVAGFTGIGVFAILTSGSFAGVAALGFPALGFGLVYLVDSRRWWALLPAGLGGSVALLATFDLLFPRWDTTPILFLDLPRPSACSIYCRHGAAASAGRCSGRGVHRVDRSQQRPERRHAGLVRSATAHRRRLAAAVVVAQALKKQSDCPRVVKLSVSRGTSSNENKPFKP